MPVPTNIRNRKKVQMLSEQTDRAECSVSGSMSWMLRMSQLAGVAPVRFDGRRISVSDTLFYVYCVVMTAMNIMATYALVLDLKEDLDRSVHVRRFSQWLLFTMELFAVMLTASVAVYTGRSRLTEVIECLSTVQKIKEAINYQDHVSVCLERKKRVVLLSLLVFSTSCVLIEYIVYILYGLQEGKDVLILILYSGYEATYMLVFVVQMQFLITTLEVYEAFKGLNDALDGVSPQNSLQSVAANQIWPKSAEETIRHLASEYNNLCLVMKRLEKAFGCSVILLLLSCLLHMVIIANYTSYHIIVGKQMIGGYSAPLPLKLTWCVLHFLRTVFIIEPSHHTRVEMDRTNLLVSQLILQNNDYVVSEELERFYRYIVLNKTTYTPMGICTLNRPLLASILSSVVTYLVISVQFQILEASENS